MRASLGLLALLGACASAPRHASRLPYFEVTPTLECVDDPRSAHYNALLEGAGVAKDWTSSERMQNLPTEYALGIVVAHNGPPGLAGAGSCIFLHVWKRPDATTSGCTAMDQSAVEALVGWLDPAAAPVLVQLPEVEYTQL